MLDYILAAMITIGKFAAYIVFYIFAYKGIKAFNIYIKKNSQ